MAKASDCKADTGEAVTYYEKYLSEYPKNPAAKKRLNELKQSPPATSTATSNATSEEDARIARTMNKKPSIGLEKRKTKLILDDSYFDYTFGYGIPTNKANNPFGHFYCNSLSMNRPLFNNNAMITFSPEASLFTRGNKPWFGRAAGVSDTEVVKVKNQLTGGAWIGFYAIPVNTNTVALTAGLQLGARAQFYDVEYEGYGSDLDPTIQVYCGLRANLYFARAFVAYVEYQKGLKSKYSSGDDDYMTPVTIDLNYSMITLGIGFGFMTRP
jgi:hypothetical protein